LLWLLRGLFGGILTLFAIKMRSFENDVLVGFGSDGRPP
jgi:hypothetical protein